MGVEQLSAEHLIACANAHDRGPAPARVDDALGQTSLTQPVKIGDCCFTAGDDDKVGDAKLLRPLNVAHAYSLLVAQRVEIVEVCNMRQTHHRYVDRRLQFARDAVLQSQGVLLRDVDIEEIRQNACDRHAGTLAQEIESRSQQRRIAAKLVYDMTFHQRPLLGIQQDHGANELSKDASTVDVRYEQDWRIGVASDSHVDDVVLLEVDLRRAAGTLNHNHVIVRAQAVESRGRRFPNRRFQLVIFAGGGNSLGASHHDDLRATVALGLEQDRVHLHLRSHHRRGSLHGLGTANLASVRRGIGIQRHVLRFERSDLKTILSEYAAERSGQD